ncbi:hypothetical protein CEXT_665761 [Caerostris extrusa]|uniref:Uncharacterized protein n=1 Tax=Caerostris extrusa TaxID=172846 RepID=A0AAV4T8C7_CAEEX|nr:hypothetical protein CEXT_665761 [Caerostris extrusa]
MAEKHNDFKSQSLSSVQSLQSQPEQQPDQCGAQDANWNRMPRYQLLMNNHRLSVEWSVRLIAGGGFNPCSQPVDSLDLDPSSIS